MTKAQAQRLRELAIAAATAFRVDGILCALGRQHDKEAMEYQNAVVEFDAELCKFVADTT
jgi:hypothetical protein